MRHVVFMSGKDLKMWTRGQVFIIDVGLDFEAFSAEVG